MRKLSSVLAVMGLTVCVALISLVLYIRYAYQGYTDAYLERQFEAINYEISAMNQPHLQKPYFTEQEMNDLLATDEGAPNIRPIVSYTVTLFPAAERSQDDLLPNVLVIGINPAFAKEWDPEGAEADWPSALGENRIIVSESVADRLHVQVGNFVQLLDHDNRKHEFQVELIRKEEGLLAYRGVQNADAAAIIQLERARSLFDLPVGTYTSAIGDLYALSPWHSQLVKQEPASNLEGFSSFSSYFFGIITLTAIIMGIILTINLFRLISEERRLGTGVMRAIGFSRLDLKRILRLEGLCYAMLSGLLGSVAGIGLAAWIMGSKYRLFEQEMQLDQMITWQIGLKAMLTGCSMGVCIVFGCVWLVSQISLRHSAQTEMTISAGAIRRDPTKRAYAFHNSISLVTLTLIVSIVILISIPNVRQAWFDGVDLPLWSAGLFVAIPLLIYAGVWWLEWGIGLLLLLLRRVPASFAMVNLALNQLKGNRVRSGLLMLMFCLVCCFVSFAIVLSNFSQYFVDHADYRKETGGYNYFVEDQRVISSNEFKTYLDEINYPDERYPEYASVVSLPWQEAEWREYEIYGVNLRYAETNRFSVSAMRDGEEDGGGVSLWKKLAIDPEAAIVSTSALSFMKNNDWEWDNDEITFQINGQTVSKRIIGVVNEESAAYPATTGIWLNEQEVLRLGQDAKGLHSVLFMRFDSVAIGQEWQERSERGLAKFNVYPLQSATENKIYFLRDMGFLLAMFERFNYLAMAIGVAGLAVVMARLVKIRKRQLGVLRTLGITPKLLQLYVFVEGFMLSIFGSVLGFVVGGYYAYVLCESQVVDTPIDFDFAFPASKLIMSFLCFVILILVSNLWSVRYVYRVSPMESTKYLTS